MVDSIHRRRIYILLLTIHVNIAPHITGWYELAAPFLKSSTITNSFTFFRSRSSQSLEPLTICVSGLPYVPVWLYWCSNTIRCVFVSRIVAHPIIILHRPISGHSFTSTFGKCISSDYNAFCLIILHLKVTVIKVVLCRLTVCVGSGCREPELKATQASTAFSNAFGPAGIRDLVMIYEPTFDSLSRYDRVMIRYTKMIVGTSSVD